MLTQVLKFAISVIIHVKHAKQTLKILIVRHVLLHHLDL
jgi:hypothetical protein